MDKKSFILYLDLCEIFDELSDEESGALIKAIIKYVKAKYNNEEFSPEMPRLMKAIFKSFKAHIDRDFVKWEEKREKRRKAGKISAQKKQGETNNADEQKQHMPTNANTCQHMLTDVNTKEHMPANADTCEQMSTVNVSVSVSDSVSVNDSVNDSVNGSVNVSDSVKNNASIDKYSDSKDNKASNGKEIYTLSCKKNCTTSHSSDENPSLKKEKSKKITSLIPYEEIISYLNERCKTNYKASTKVTRRLIKARWNEGFRIEDFKKVIDNMAEEWLCDTEMCRYLRPQTLFGSNFESYLNRVKPDLSKSKLERKIKRIGEEWLMEEMAKENFKKQGVQTNAF